MRRLSCDCWLEVGEVDVVVDVVVAPLVEFVEGDGSMVARDRVAVPAERAAVLSESTSLYSTCTRCSGGCQRVGTAAAASSAS